MIDRSLFSISNLILLLVIAHHGALLCRAQTNPVAVPAKTPETQTVQESVKTFIEEVRIPEVARNVDSQYIVSYKPLRPLGSLTAKEYRRIDVFSRRVGLNVRARRGYVAKIQQ